MAGGDSEKSKAINVVSIKGAHLAAFQKHHSGLQPLTISRSKLALVKRMQTPTFTSSPHPVLPGTRASVSLTLTKENNLNFVREWNEALTSDDWIYRDAATSGLEQKKLEMTLNQQRAGKFLDMLHTMNVYLVELAHRVSHLRLSAQPSSDSQADQLVSESVHVIVPKCLHQTIINLEHLFVMDDLEQAWKELQDSFAELDTFLKTKRGGFKSLVEELREINARAVGAEPDLDVAPIALPEATFSDSADETSRLFSTYLGSNPPPVESTNYVKGVLKNLVFDFYFVNPAAWYLQQPLVETATENVDLTFRLSETTEELSKGYDQASEKQKLAASALKERTKQTDDSKLQQSLDQAVEILNLIREPITAKHVLEHGPEMLKSRLDDIIRTHSLTEVMVAEVQMEFPGLGDTFGKLDPKDLGEKFADLTDVRDYLAQVEQLLNEGKELIAESAQKQDIQSRREEASTGLTDFRRRVTTIRKESNDVGDALVQSQQLLVEVSEWVDDKREELGGNVQPEARLWIGLGQAGGQILRECLSYAVANDADARCSALLTALGLSPSDKRSLRGHLKSSSSGPENERLNAKRKIRTIFDKKAHVLAINLGEEIDLLAQESAPGFYFWGDALPENKSTDTVRTKRNILKLMKSGDGAGGATGVGRAYGFRYGSDIGDALRDVGTKSARTPAHIVITHSLSGGSGSGMVLPVLERVRRTFGQEPVIWVMSVGEGRQENNEKAMMNTPFIVSDVLQAYYNGIHAIEDPLTLTDFRQFTYTLQTTHASMNASLRKLVAELNGTSLEDEVDDDADPLITIRQFITTQKKPTNDVFMRRETKHKSSLDSLFGLKTTKHTGLKTDWVEKHKTTLKQNTNPWSPGRTDLLIQILPTTKDEADLFSKWCRVQESGGVYPAVNFWNAWRESMNDPLSMIFEGRKPAKKVERDDDEFIVEYFDPTLTGLHLRTVGWHLVREIKPDHPQAKQKPDTPEPLTPLFETLLERMSPQSEEKAESIRSILTEYATKLDQFNEALKRMDRHINSLSGSGKDPGVKSILVSNAHIELGVINSGRVDAKGEIYTVYNSVLLDLMLNVIAPRLPKEPGVYDMSDNVLMDHADMMNHTVPPMVIGMLKHRDQLSTLEEHQSFGTAYQAFPDDIQTMLNAMVSWRKVTKSNAVGPDNLAYLADDVDGVIQDFVKSIFGPRYRYLWSVNPYDTMELDAEQLVSVNRFCDEVASLWDQSDENVYGLERNRREMLFLAIGISGLHVGNLLRWFSLVDMKFFVRATNLQGRNYLNISKEMEKNKTNLWSQFALDGRFDQGVLQIDNLTQRYRRVSTPPNLDLFSKVLPMMGLHNAELLRAVSPSYISTFYPLAVMHFLKQEEREFNLIKDMYKTTKLDKSCKVLEIMSEGGKVDAKQIYIQEAENVLDDWFAEDEHPNASPRASEDIGDLFTSEYPEFNDFVTSNMDVQFVPSSQHGVELRTHPRLLRYLSVVREVPVQRTDLLLPARSTAATMPRYMMADRLTRPLDNHTWNKVQSGAAAPSFSMGLDILNQLRVAALTPDEKALDFTAMVRMLLMTEQNATALLNNVSQQIDQLNLDSSSLKPLFDEILNCEYPPLDAYDQPGMYPEQTKVLLQRLHKVRPLLDYFSQHLPEGWTGQDRSGMDYLSLLINDVEFSFGDEQAVEEALGNDIDSVPQLKEWIRHTLDIVVHEINLEVPTTNASDDEMAESPENTSLVIRLRQLFYDIATLTNEALRQAEYLQEDGSARNVHFEMNGLSDRLLGLPDSLTILIHDRKKNLEVGAVQSNVRNSTTAFLSSHGMATKEFSTTAPFGPSSLITTIFTKAPAADVADQFYNLVHLKNRGLGGVEPNWAMMNSKLHPYMFLYNLLWLSVEVVGTWSPKSNHLYARRFQIPTKVIEHHFSDPQRLDTLRSQIEDDSTSFKGDVKVPGSDNRDFRSVVNIDPESKFLGYRNIIKYIAIMILRHYHHAEEEDQQKVNTILGNGELEMMERHFSSSMTHVDIESLFEQKTGSSAPAIRAGRKSGSWRKKVTQTKASSESQYVEFDDTVGDRAVAWATAYVKWVNFSFDEDESPGLGAPMRQSDKFDASIPQAPESTDFSPASEPSIDFNEP